MFLASLNTEVFKYALIFCAMPLWLPFLKALLAELNDALAAEGGLFGRPPTKQELAFIERDPNRAKSPLVSQEFDPGAPRGSGRTQGPPSASPGTARTSAPTPQSRSGVPTQAGFSKPRGARGFARKDQRRR